MSTPVSDDQKQLIDEIATERGFEEYEINFNPGSAKGDGYLGNITAVEIKEKSSEKVLHLVLKTAHTAEKARKELSVRKMFERENFIYGVVFRDFQDLQEQFFVDDKFQAIAKYYGGLTETTPECLVLENLTKKGFSLWNRKIPMDAQHVKAVFKEYGKFHALSYAMKNLRPETYANRTKELSCVLTDNTIDKFLLYCKNKAYEAVGGNDKLIQAVDRYNDGLLDFLYSCSQNRDKYTVVMHGDSWCNNMMFKYEDKEKAKPSKVCILDWQLSSVGSVVQDLVYFFYTCSSEECMKNYQSFVEIYHKSVSKMLKLFDLDVDEILPFEELSNQWKRHAKYGLFVSFIIFKLMLAEPEEVLEFSKICKERTLFDMYKGEISNNEEYIRRLRIVINTMVENEFI